MKNKISILIAFLVALILPVQAQTDEEVVQSIRDDIQAVKAKTRETRNLLRDQERDLRKLTVELEKTRRTIQQNKQKERDARKRGKEFTPKPVVRTYTSIYGTEHTPAPSLAAKGVDTTAEKKEKEKKGTVEKEEKVKDEKKAAEKVKDEKGKGEKEVKDEKEIKKAEKKGKKEETSPLSNREGQGVGPSGKSKAAPTAPNRRVSDKEALRLQKQRNKYYEDQLKEKQKAAKEAEKTRKKMEKEQKKDEPPVASARRQRDTKETEKAESEE